MRWFCVWSTLLMLVLATPSTAQTGFYLPAPVTSPGQDEFRASDGTSCRSTMDGAKRVEVGTFATGAQQHSSYDLPGYVAPPRNANIGVYGRFTWSLDSNPERIDCSKLFQLELEKKQLEVEMLKQSLRAAEQQLQAAKRQPVEKIKVARGVPPL